MARRERLSYALAAMSPVAFLTAALAVCWSLPAAPRAHVQESEQGKAGHVLELTLEDAIRIGLERNLDLESEALATEVAHFNALGSWGFFDPVLTATATIQSQDQQGQSQLSGGTVVTTDRRQLNTSLVFPFRTGGSVEVSYFRTNDKTNNSFSLFDVSTSDSIAVTLVQPLLKGAWSRYATTAQRQLELDLERQRAREAEVRQKLVLDVTTAYWDLVSAIEQLRVRELAVERAERQLAQDKRRYEIGSGTEVDILQSETTLAQQQEALLNARFQRLQAEDTLRRRIFQRSTGELEDFLDEWDWPIEPLTALPEIEDVRLDWRASFDLALRSRPEIEQRRFEIDAAAVRLQAAHSDRLPTLDLNLTSRSNGFSNDPSEALDIATGWDFPDNTASLNFVLPLRNRAGSNGVRSARAALRQARILLQRQELDILAEVRAAVRDIAYRAEALRAAEKSGALAQRQFESEEVRLDIGLSTTFQVLQFQETLAEARSAEVTARAAYAKAQVKLRQVEGTLGVEPSSSR